MSTKILLAEDDMCQAESFIGHLKKVGMDNDILHFQNGRKLMEFLRDPSRKREEYIIVLDLYMPIMNGFEVLQELKTDEALKTIPIIVMTTEDGELQITKCYGLGCNIYIIKKMSPNDLRNVQELVGKLASNISLGRA